MLEEATQASCPPCMPFNTQTLVPLLDANPETTILLSYQVWWPGYDPMYLDNPDEVADRIEYYGVNAAPTIIIQGSPNAQTLNQGLIDGQLGDSEFAINLNAEVNDGVLSVTGNIEATMAASGNFRLRIALAEHLISIEDAPGGTNGETEYHNVFKRFVGDGSAGTALASTWEVGDMHEINETLALGGTNIYNYDELEVVAWIQNETDKYIHQAAKVGDVALNSNFSNNGIGVEVTGLPASVCSGEQTISPVFKLQNGGSANLTSADIIYSVNGGTPQMMSWTGDLSIFATDEVTLDPITFNAELTGNTIDVTISNPNGVDDENADDSAASAAIDPANASTNMAELTLITDNYGNETYWQVSNSMGEVVAAGGNAGVGLTNIGVGSGAPPADPGAYGNNETIVVEIPIDLSDCYEFIMTDYYGDGICCGFGNGSYVVRDHNGVIMFTGGEFTDLQSSPFEGTFVVGVEELTEVTEINLFPNPVSEVLKVNFELAEASQVQVEIYNITGQRVQQLGAANYGVGVNQMDIDASQLANGIYILRMSSQDKELNRRFTAQH